MHFIFFALQRTPNLRHVRCGIVLVFSVAVYDGPVPSLIIVQGTSGGGVFLCLGVMDVLADGLVRERRNPTREFITIYYIYIHIYMCVVDIYNINTRTRNHIYSWKILNYLSVLQYRAWVYRVRLTIATCFSSQLLSDIKVRRNL